MSCIHCGPSVDFYWSEPNDLLRNNNVCHPYNPNWDTPHSNLKPNGVIREVRQKFLTCIRPVPLRTATRHTHGKNQIQRFFPNRSRKAIRRDSSPVEQGFNPYNVEIFLYKPWKPIIYFEFEILFNVLISSFCFVWIPMLWVYGH